MFFLLDNKAKVIFGWSAKCGCTHVKRIFRFLQNQNIYDVHTEDDVHNLPDDIENYKTIIISRNPYKRLVSGFLDKYRKNGEFRHLWKDTITFSKFINELVKNDWKMCDRHHFIPQTKDDFDERIIESKCICYDIENIDYNHIEKIFNVKIPEEVLQIKQGHERKKYDFDFDEYVYDLDMDIYYDFNVDTKYFYNDELKKKVYEFYKDDFVFFEKFGIDYENLL